MARFIGREKEIESLHKLMFKKSASLIVVSGRRRIGKSRLIEEFMKKEGVESFTFSGLPPEDMVTANDQRKEFVRQLATQGIPGVSANDWGDIFWHLGKNVESGKKIILLDEISWMGSKDPLFLGKLKNAWDLQFKKNPNLILILCGSVSTWINDNLINNTGFMGRFSLYLHLDELPLHRCNEFWGKRKDHLSSYEKFKLLAITGGIPRYLEEIDSDSTSEENIHNLCFNPSGILVHEFDRIFHDLFSRRGPTYKKLISGLISGDLEQEELLLKTNFEQGGSASRYLEDLEKTGFINRDFSWDLKTGKPSKLSRYRLRDNYLRFYLKYIEPNKTKILSGQFQEKSVNKLPGWEIIMGLQFENLVKNNNNLLHQCLEIDPTDVLACGPFFQTKTKAREGSQIDYLIQTKFGVLYVCEIKFSRSAIGMEVVTDVKKKIQRLQTPKHISFFPVLIHVGEVKSTVEDSEFFAKTIDFGRMLDEPRN